MDDVHIHTPTLRNVAFLYFSHNIVYLTKYYLQFLISCFKWLLMSLTAFGASAWKTGARIWCRIYGADFWSRFLDRVSGALDSEGSSEEQRTMSKDRGLWRGSMRKPRVTEEQAGARPLPRLCACSINNDTLLWVAIISHCVCVCVGDVQHYVVTTAPKLALASQQVRSNWNFNTLCRMVPIFGQLFLR